MTPTKFRIILYYNIDPKGVKDRAHRIRLYKSTATVIDSHGIAVPEHGDHVEFMPGFPEAEMERVKALYADAGIKQTFTLLENLDAEPMAPVPKPQEGGDGKATDGELGGEGKAPGQDPAQVQTPADPTQGGEGPALIEIPAEWASLPWFGKKALAIDIGDLAGKNQNGLTKEIVEKIIGDEVTRRKAIGAWPHAE